MVLLMPGDRRGQVTGLTQMGGEGGHWIGMAPFVGQRHFVQNIGDGTFAHSGSLAIRAAVAAGVNVTFKLLRNSAVAMTGGQQPVGERSLRQLTALLRRRACARSWSRPTTRSGCAGRPVTASRCGTAMTCWPCSGNSRTSTGSPC